MRSVVLGLFLTAALAAPAAASPLTHSATRLEVAQRFADLGIRHYRILGTHRVGARRVAVRVREYNVRVCPSPCVTLSAASFEFHRRLDWRLVVRRDASGRLRVRHPWL